MDHLVSPSLLAADFGNLENEIRMINRSEADWLHLDIMDGVFVPNISFGFPVIKASKKNSSKTARCTPYDNRSRQVSEPVQ